MIMDYSPSFDNIHWNIITLFQPQSFRTMNCIEISYQPNNCKLATFLC